MTGHKKVLNAGWMLTLQEIGMRRPHDGEVKVRLGDNLCWVSYFMVIQDARL